MDIQAATVGSLRTNLTEQSSFETDVAIGLSHRIKYLPSKYFYDAAGSALFERITGLPEYYVTRSEIGILTNNGLAIGSLFPSNCALVEFGAASSRKSRILLSAAVSISTYIPQSSPHFLK